MTGKSNFKPSPYIVAGIHGYTKHIYAGAERVCTKLGSGGLDSLFQTSDSLLYNARILIKKQLNDMPGRRIDVAPVSCNRRIDGTTGGDLTTHQTEKVSVRVDANFKYERFHDEMDDCRSDHGTETSRYFYHPDHLGSASWITDANGQPIQHMQYLPYGETRIDQRTSTYNERYTFTGKEKDSETGYYYFGARYYNPDLSLWLSVDPMADKYPSLSPYNYCAWNPLKLVDSDGREVGKTYDKITGELIHDDHINDGKVYLGTKRDGSDREYLTQENCIKDMSAAFDKQLEETRDFFQQSAKAYDEKPSSDMFTYFTGKAHKLENFRKLVTDGADFDLKAKGVFTKSNLSKDGGKRYAFYHGKLLRYDDFGNYNYGVAANAYGLPEIVATAGAGLNQLWKGIKGESPVDYKNVRGLGDDLRDTEMIRQGYYHKF